MVILGPHWSEPFDSGDSDLQFALARLGLTMVDDRRA
jgi:hypothetical protein